MAIKFFNLFIALATTALVSCNTKVTVTENETQDELADSTKIAADSTEMLEEESDVAYNLPSALQLAYVFRKSNASFVASSTNDKANVARYNTTNFKRALNFGVYSSDLAYCLFNKQYQEAKNYLKAGKDLGANLGLNEAFESDNLAERFDKNLTKEDSLVKIVTSIQRKTDNHFEQNKQKHITALTFVGAWTESIYIAFQANKIDAKTAGDKKINAQILSSCLEQLALTETIIKALRVCKNSDPEISNLITTLESINNKYKNIPAVKLAEEKEEDIDFASVNFSGDEKTAISESITALRKTIVE